ncbi:MAG: peptidase M61, partial [Aureibaculum sp.]|nr:peptidase M61 [Aureibaculum sp.]
MKQNVLKLFLILLVAGFIPAKATTNNHATGKPIETTIDLTQVIDDKVPVTINPGRFTIDTVTYRLPKVVQGTYTVSDFGSFIENFKAFDYKGNEITVEKLDTNSWTIGNAENLDKITYLVNDTFDIENKDGQATPFSPSGTNIEPKNYVLNLHGFIGYF